MLNHPWVVVEYKGTEYEYVVREFGSMAGAIKWMNWYYRDQIEECGVDVMKRCPDGSRTTVF